MNKAVFKKWWLWAIVGVILVGVSFSIWYTQVYTSEWGKGLSKEQKMVFEHAEKTNKSSFNLGELTNKEVKSLYAEMEDSGISTNKFKESLIEIEKRPDDTAYVPSKLVYVFQDFIYYKKELANDIKLSEKAKKIMPYKMHEDSK